ncbi:ParA family protein [Rhodococcus qingshengii]|uniref:ParA family protein n=1 Tax=Rhodococcus qingshengii TaxID=334542 RepID=UPI001BE876F5|nr:ParA family protein [Rhodococcus qingshengii]MBT2272692.1 ParA family protein [Rhodococcus qingshengii]
MLVFTVTNLKGGSTKTTTAAYLLHALHEAGLNVLGVDADGENESLLNWQTLGDWPFPVIGMPVNNLHKQLPGIANNKYDAVVIDTPPMKEQRGIVLSSMRIATHVICPLAPTTMEFSRLPAVRELLEEANDLRSDGTADPIFAVLLTRTIPNASSTEVFREMITEAGDHVLRATVGRREQFAQAFGLPIDNAANTAYGDAVEELLEIGNEDAA